MEKGIVAALITPLNEDESIDITGLGNLIERVIAGGVKGLFVGGTVGEGLALRDAERQTLYRQAVQITRRRIPVLASVTDTGTLRSCDLARMASKADVDGVVATLRIGFPMRKTEEGLQHLKAIADASSVPVWFYENPYTTAITSAFDQLETYLALPQVQGLKFSTPDRTLFDRCVTELGQNKAVLTGNVSDIAHAARIGAFGAVSGCASMAPKLCADTFQLTLEGKIDEAEAAQQKLNSHYVIYGPQGMPLWPTAQKHVLKRLRVLKTSTVTAPFLNLTPAEEYQIDKFLETNSLLTLFN